MFQECSALTYVDPMFFEILKDKHFSSSYMFYNCKSLLYSPISLFKISIGNGILYHSALVCGSKLSMFEGCSALKLIDLLYINADDNPAYVDINVKSMFKDCISLSAVHACSFVDNEVGIFNLVFMNCISLLYINFIFLSYSGEYSQNIINGGHSLFLNCSKLTRIHALYLDLYLSRYERIKIWRLPEHLLIVFIIVSYYLAIYLKYFLIK